MTLLRVGMIVVWLGAGGCAGGRAMSLAQVDTLVDRHAQLREKNAARARVDAREWLTAERTATYVRAPGRNLFAADAEARLLAEELFPGTDVEPGTDEPTERSESSRRPLPRFWDTVRRDIREMPQELWSDTKAVYTSTPNLVILGLTYGGSLALQSTGPDSTVEDSLNDKQLFKSDIGEAFGALGNPATHFGLAGLWYLAGQQRQDENTYQVSKTLFSALMINGASTMVGKLAVWDKSPNGEYFAFPSGHASSSFTVASVMHQAYGPWVGAPLYALSVFVAAERLDNGEHYLSDVIMGSVMGLVIGHTVAGERDIEIFGGRIVPYVDPYLGATGIAWHKQF